ncbi:SIR2 family NAD-dependent protein deacylase [Symmachiella macrocystis]|uniref:SIR2 family NAD-dependent protein deacylase n=1 Tax=Symmachiella macrocystis TaxID=2527985 RepID=UPI0018D2CE18|nr:NAD-dependent deacylase [Symmachiella macrocystis]
MPDLPTIAEWIREADSIVAFTGAGISTESGIPDFRSPGGIWSKSTPVYYDDFVRYPESRYEYWRQKSIAHREFASAQPNVGHTVLADWETAGRLDGVITQNIDGLHQAAGSQQVLELHGTARFVACLECESRFDVDPWVLYFQERDEVPPCPECGSWLKHATVSFGQALPREVLSRSMELARGADLFIALGSSLVVEPAASLPRLAKESGGRLVIINRDTTDQDRSADAVIHASIGETLTAINALL